MSLRVVLIRYKYLKKFITWKSLDGFGITIDWPKRGWEGQVREIQQICNNFLPKDFILIGPEMAAGGTVVMYVWSKKQLSLILSEGTADNWQNLLEERIRSIKFFQAEVVSLE